MSPLSFIVVVEHKGSNEIPPLVDGSLAEYQVSRDSVFESEVVQKSGTGTVPSSAGLCYSQNQSTFDGDGSEWCSPQSVIDFSVTVLNYLLRWVLERVGLRKSF